MGTKSAYSAVGFARPARGSPPCCPQHQTSPLRRCASLRVCDSPIDLDRDGGDGGAEMVVEDRGR